MTYDYAWERLHAASLSLCSSSLFKVRVQYAVQALHVLKAKDFPPYLRNDFDALWKQMTSTAAKGNEGSIAATIAVLPEEELEIASKKIMSMYDELCRYQEPVLEAVEG